MPRSPRRCVLPYPTTKRKQTRFRATRTDLSHHQRKEAVLQTHLDHPVLVLVCGPHPHAIIHHLLFVCAWPGMHNTSGGSPSLCVCMCVCVCLCCNAMCFDSSSVQGDMHTRQSPFPLSKKELLVTTPYAAVCLSHKHFMSLSQSIFVSCSAENVSTIASCVTLNSSEAQLHVSVIHVH